MGQSLTEEQVRKVERRSYNDMLVLFRMLDQAERDMGRPLARDEKLVVAMAWDMWVTDTLLLPHDTQNTREVRGG